MSDPTVFRRRNVLALFQLFAEDAVATGAAPKGLEQAFAVHVQISPSMWSQIKSARPIGDKLARQIEQHCGKRAGWLDEDRPAAAPTPGEQQFLALALQAWRAADSAGRKALKLQIKQVVQDRAQATPVKFARVERQ